MLENVKIKMLQTKEIEEVCLDELMIMFHFLLRAFLGVVCSIYSLVDMAKFVS